MSPCIPTMTVGKSLSHVPPNQFFIISLGLGIFLTLPLCNASLCVGLSPFSCPWIDYIFNTYHKDRNRGGGLTHNRRKNGRQ